MSQISIDDFRARIDATKIQCLVPGCGYKAFALASHLRDVHGLSSAQYKNNYGPTSPLASPIVGELNRRLDRKVQMTDELQFHVKHFSFEDDETKLLEEAGKVFQTDPALMTLVPKPIPHFKMTAAAKTIAYAVQFSRNLFVEGPTGCGKTMEVLHAHSLMKRPIKRVNMQGDVTAKNFIGEPKANAQGTYYEYGVLPRAMMDGVTLLVDEIDFTPPHIGVVLHPILEEGHRTLFLPYTGETIKAKDGFTVIATANTGGKGDANGIYTGTEVLNTAFLDRFPLKLKVDYLSTDDEFGMLVSQFPTANVPDVRMMVKIAGEIRTAFKQATLSITMSTRKLVDYFEFVKSMPAKEALKLTLLNWLDDDDRTTVENIVDRCGFKLK